MKKYRTELYKEFKIEAYQCEDGEDIPYYIFKVLNLNTGSISWAPVDCYEKSLYNTMLWLDAGCPPKEKYNFHLKDLQKFLVADSD